MRAARPPEKHPGQPSHDANSMQAGSRGIQADSHFHVRNTSGQIKFPSCKAPIKHTLHVHS